MVSEHIVNYRKEEIMLAYSEMERRGMVPRASEESVPAVLSPLGFALGAIVFGVEFFLIHQEDFIAQRFLSLPRALALAALVSFVAGYWQEPKPELPFVKYFLLSLSTVLLGLLAFWEMPNLLRYRLPFELAFGIPILIFSIASYWLFKSFWGSMTTKFLSWLIGSILFTIICTWIAAVLMK